jgi:hypothetical protein
MSRMQPKSVACVLMLVMCWGCLSTRKETQTQTIKVNPTPADARVWVKDDSGQRFMGLGPALIKQRYEQEVTEFNEWWWAMLPTSLVAATFGSLFMALDDTRDDAQWGTGLGLVAAGGIGTILSLIFCTRGQLKQGESRPISQKIMIGADRDGYLSKGMDIEIPGGKKEINLELLKGNQPATVAEPGPGPRRAIVAVFDVHDASGRFDKEMLGQLTVYLGTALMKTGQYKIIPRDQLRTRLLEEKKGSYSKCVDESCQIELGKAVAAQKSLATQLLRVGDKCAVTANLFDLKTETAEKGAMTNTGCTPDDLLAAMEQIAKQLSGE